MKKEIIFVIGSLVRGGAEKVINELADRYIANGYSVSILLLLFNKVDLVVNPNIKILNFTGGNKPRIFRIFYWLRTLSKYFKNHKQATIVSFVARINNLVLLTANKKGHRIIISERNDPRYDGRGFITKLLAKILYPKSSLIVFQTIECAKLFGKKIQNNSVVIGNPISINQYVSCVPARKHALLSLGRLSKQKDFETLIKSVGIVRNKYTDVTLEIYGDGPEEQYLKLSVQKYKLDDCVFINKNIPNVFEKINNASIYVSSSLYEGMSNSLLEASMSGLPCIITPCLGTDFIKDGYNGYYFNFKDYKKLSEIIIGLFDNEEQYLHIRQNAINYGKSRPFDNVMNEWVRCIDNIN